MSSRFDLSSSVVEPVYWLLTYGPLALGRLMLGAAATAGFLDGLNWLRTGAWDFIETAWLIGWLGLGVPQSSWVGLQRLIDGTAHAALALSLFGLGILFEGLGRWWRYEVDP